MRSALRGLALLVVLSASACRENREEAAPQATPVATPPPAPPAPSAAPAPAPPPPPPLVSVVPIGQETFAGQLLSGFFAPESGAWRWTGTAFSVKLAIPPGAAEKGGTLRLNFTLPKPLIAARPTTTVKAKVGDAETSKSFSKQGDNRLEFALPPAALVGEAIVAEFTVDKPFTPGGGDDRALGVIATSAELVSK